MPNNVSHRAKQFAYAIFLLCFLFPSLNLSRAAAEQSPTENLNQESIQAGSDRSTVEQTIKFEDTTPPTVLSITRVGPSHTNQNAVEFLVTFSEPVIGLDMAGPDYDDFRLTTGPGITGAHITSISGSGTVYTVTVNTGSGDGGQDG
jgi:hypothetical protein